MIEIKEKYPDKTIWLYTGNSWEMMKKREVVRYLDVLVDGPFIQSQKNLSLRFRGSENQRLIDVPASLESNKIVLWEDWQGNGRGIRE